MITIEAEQSVINMMALRIGFCMNSGMISEDTAKAINTDNFQSVSMRDFLSGTEYRSVSGFFMTFLYPWNIAYFLFCLLIHLFDVLKSTKFDTITVLHADATHEISPL